MPFSLQIAVNYRYKIKNKAYPYRKREKPRKGLFTLKLLLFCYFSGSISSTTKVFGLILGRGFGLSGVGSGGGSNSAVGKNK